MKPELLIHLGAAKTGSTAIQSFFDKNRNKLLADHILYPSLNTSRNHGKLVEFINNKNSDYLKLFIKNVEESILLNSPRLVVLSAESFWPGSEKFVRLLVNTLEPLFSKISVIIYLRNQIDLWISLYSQQAKSLKVKFDSPVWNCSQVAGKDVVERGMHYNKVLDIYTNIIGIDNVHRRIYERNNFHNGDILNDFLPFCKINQSGYIPASINENLNWGWKAVEYSKIYASNPKILNTFSIQHWRAIIQKTVKLMHEKGLEHWKKSPADNYLTKSQQQEIFLFYENSNRLLSDRYFNGKILFENKTYPTTALRLEDMPKKELRIALQITKNLIK